MNQKKNNLYAIPYYLWIVLFVVTPLALVLYKSFFDIHGHFTFANYVTFFSSRNYLVMTASSFFYAFLITLVTFMLSYPMAYALSKTKHKQLWLMLIIMPTWINLLLKAYAFIGLLSHGGMVNNFLSFFGIAPQQLLFTDAAFLIVAGYIELPFMIMPIFNSINEIPTSFLEASLDLGASKWDTLRRVVFPLSLRGVRSGVQAVFIPSLSLFMLTRLIGGNRVITLGTAVEQHFLVTQNWGMGSTIGVVLMILMVVVMFITRDRQVKGGVRHD
ncbi:ABC transporter permease [Vaginisenegalia massiliensis]|uniref:ABC transporter permease n=1 Tax=Vaginisenegalia massiliensis TaxID=2058294 RepID=UPI000F5312D3|nr:ABC transporter permease [Vaginisenegalia massiliensis]